MSSSHSVPTYVRVDNEEDSNVLTDIKAPRSLKTVTPVEIRDRPRIVDLVYGIPMSLSQLFSFSFLSLAHSAKSCSDTTHRRKLCNNARCVPSKSKTQKSSRTSLNLVLTLLALMLRLHGVGLPGHPLQNDMQGTF